MPRHFTDLELSVLKSLGVGPNDPAADAMLNRIAEIKDLETGGDPAFQSGSAFFQTKLGSGVESALSQFGTGPEAPSGDDLTACLTGGDQAACDRVFGGGGAGGGAGGGGAGGGGSFLSSQAGQEAANAFALQQLQQEQEFAAAEAEKARLFEREQELERLKAERERIFTDMLGTDPVRAVLFALGIGGEILPGGDRFANLAPLPGAQQQGRQTQQALEGLLGLGQRKSQPIDGGQVTMTTTGGPGGINIGEAGVTGLGSAARAAAAFGGQAGGTGGNISDQQKLLLSAFGVGAKRGKGRPGQSREETLRQIASVTPTGVL